MPRSRVSSEYYSEDANVSPLDYNGLLLNDLTDIENIVPKKVVPFILINPGVVKIYFYQIKSLWFHTKQYARKGIQEFVEKEIQQLTDTEPAIEGKQVAAYVFYHRCNYLLDAVIEGLRENNKLEYLRSPYSNNEEGEMVYRPIDYNSLLFKILSDLDTITPRIVIPKMFMMPGVVSIYYWYVRYFWMLSKHHAKAEQQKEIEKEFEDLDNVEMDVIGRQLAANLFFHKCESLREKIEDILREHDKYERPLVHASAK